MTFEELIRESAIYANETLTKEGDDFVEVETVNKLKNGINFAYMKLCRLGLIKRSIPVVNSLVLEDFISDISVITIDDVPIKYDIIDNKILFNSNEEATMYYSHIPPKLLSYSDEPQFPDRIVDHKIMCFYAAFHMFNIESDAQASQWLSMWESEYNTIKRQRSLQSKIRPCNLYTS